MNAARSARKSSVKMNQGKGPLPPDPRRPGGGGTVGTPEGDGAALGPEFSGVGEASAGPGDGLSGDGDGAGDGEGDETDPEGASSETENPS